MSDKNHNETPEPDESGNDEDLENLSSDEKAAFEKIMSQIATDEDKSAADEAVSQQMAGTQSPMEEKESKTPPENERLSDDASPNAKESTDENLFDDQQAALDKIMAEIKGDAEPEPEAPPGTRASGTRRAGQTIRR